MMLLAYGCTSRCHIGKNGSEGLTVKVASYGNKSIAFGVIANGSGDRKIADVACASSIKIYSDWFFEQLKEDIIRFAESNIDQIRTEWEALQLMLRSKAYDYAVREQTGVDVLSAVLLVDTFSHNLYVLDSIGIGIYRIRKSGAELILSPHIERSVIDNGFETKHNRVPIHCLSQFEKVASTQCVSTPRWYSCSLKGGDQGKTCGESVYLLCTGNIIANSLPEELSRIFRPEEISDQLSAKIRLERLVRYGGTGSDRFDVGSGSAILIRYST